MEKIILQIKKMVEEKGLTHEELSEKMNISRSYVSMLLSGERVLNKELIHKFSEALSVSIEDLVTPMLVSKEDYQIQTRGEFKSRVARGKLLAVKVQMDDYIRLKGIYENERLTSK